MHTVDDMQRNCSFCGGYNEEDIYIKDFFDILREYSDELRSKFLFFLTGMEEISKKKVFHFEKHIYICIFRLNIIFTFKLGSFKAPAGGFENFQCRI